MGVVGGICFLVIVHHRLLGAWARTAAGMGIPMAILMGMKSIPMGMGMNFHSHGNRLNIGIITT